MEKVILLHIRIWHVFWFFFNFFYFSSSEKVVFLRDCCASVMREAAQGTTLCKPKNCCASTIDRKLGVALHC